MPLEFRQEITTIGKPELIAIGECEWHEFPGRAKAVAKHFDMTVSEKVDGLDERVWITRIGDSQFCVSWDIWIPEISIMAWDDTPDKEVVRLATGA